MDEKYEYYKKLHPEWSHEQIVAAVSVEMSAANEVTKAGKDANPNDPDLIRSVLQGAKEWLREVLPDVFAKVANFFDELINNVGKWVEKGLNYVIDAIDYLYKKGRTVVEALKEPTDK